MATFGAFDVGADESTDVVVAVVAETVKVVGDEPTEVEVRLGLVTVHE